MCISLAQALNYTLELQMDTMMKAGDALLLEASESQARLQTVRRMSKGLVKELGNIAAEATALNTLLDSGLSQTSSKAPKDSDLQHSAAHRIDMEGSGGLEVGQLAHRPRAPLPPRPPLPPQARRTRPLAGKAPLPPARGLLHSTHSTVLTTASAPPPRPPPNRELRGEASTDGLEADDGGRSHSQPAAWKPRLSLQATPAGVTGEAAKAVWVAEAEAEWAADVEKHARRRAEAKAKAEAARVRQRAEAAATRARLEVELSDLPTAMRDCVLRTYALG